MAAAVLLTAAGAALAGCGSSAPTAPRGTAGATSPGTSADRGIGDTAPASRATEASPAGESSSHASARAADTGRCHTSELRAAVGPDDPGAGQENRALVLTNTSDRTCTIHGFPGFAFVDAAGKKVAPDPARVGGPPRTVRLAPGDSAWAGLGFPNPGIVGGPTATPARVEITPPDEKAFLTVAWKGGPVSKQPPSTAASHVGPFQPGTGPGR